VLPIGKNHPPQVDDGTDRPCGGSVSAEWRSLGLPTEHRHLGAATDRPQPRHNKQTRNRDTVRTRRLCWMADWLGARARPSTIHPAHHRTNAREDNRAGIPARRQYPAREKTATELKINELGNRIRRAHPGRYAAARRVHQQRHTGSFILIDTRPNRDGAAGMCW